MHEGPRSYEVFKQNSEEFFRLYVDLCGLKPDEQILDVGCGIGRKTIRLTQYLGDGGAYEGIDIVKSGIDWCSERISRRYPRFRFQQIDVYNGYYNPGGRHKAAEYRFPYPDGSFDLVVLGSVFTHMLTDDTAHYLSEMARPPAKRPVPDQLVPAEPRIPGSRAPARAHKTSRTRSTLFAGRKACSSRKKRPPTTSTTSWIYTHGASWRSSPLSTTDHGVGGTST